MEKRLLLSWTASIVSQWNITLIIKDVEEKAEGRNPNAGREINKTKAFSNGEFMIACGDKNSTVVSYSKNIIVDKPNH